MPSYREVHKDRWLRPETIAGKNPTVTIERVTVEKLYNPASKKHEEKLIVKFRNTEVRLIVNLTQCKALEAISGTDDYTRWANLRLALSVGKASNGKDTIVIAPAMQSTTATTPAPPSQPAPSPAPAARSASMENSHLDDIDMGMGEDEPGDGDDLWDIDVPEPVHGQGQTPENPSARPGTPEKSLVHGQAPDPGARPGGENAGARPALNMMSDLCPHCHAPAGKPHAKKCPLAGEPSARPAPVHGQPGKSGARPEVTPEDRLFDHVAGLMTSSTQLSHEAKEVMRKATNADNDSTSKMSKTYLDAVLAMLEGTLILTPEEAEMTLAALLGYRIGPKSMPGQLVHGHLMKPLRDENEAYLDALMEIVNACREIYAREYEAA